MKKLLILTLALCLLLGGCGSSGSGSADTGASDSPGPDSASAFRTETEPVGENVRYELRDLYNGSGNEQGYYHIAARAAGGAEPDHCNIFYMDYATRQEIYLCNKPDCTHDNENCASYLPGSIESDYGILATDTALYLLDTPISAFAPATFDPSGSGATPEARAPAIYQMRLDGAGRTRVLELESGLHISGPYLYGGGRLYCSGAKTETKDEGNGMISASSGKQELMEFDLEKKTSRTVTGIAYDQVIGAYQDKLILCRYQFPVDPDSLLDDDNAYMENFRKATGKLVFLDPVSGTEEVFYEAGSDNVAGMTQWENKIYFSPAKNSSSILCLNLDTRKTTTVTDRLPAGKGYVSCEYGALLWTCYDDKEVNAEVTACYQINPETGVVTPMSLMIQNPYGPIRILEESGAYYLVISDYLGKEEKTWAGTMQFNVQGTVYSLLKKSDYEASKPNYIAIEAVK